jgi:hypothetical protein
VKIFRIPGAYCRNARYDKEWQPLYRVSIIPLQKFTKEPAPPYSVRLCQS